MPEDASSKTSEPESTSNTTKSKVPEVAVEDDSDPDFDDLDDVLDQFSAANAHVPAKPQSEPVPANSGPGRPSEAASDISIPHGQSKDESEEQFMARLTAEMSAAMSQMSEDPAASSATPEDLAKMGKELEEFTQRMEAEGIKPEDLLKAILGEEKGRRVSDAAKDERDRRESEVSKSRERVGKIPEEPLQPPPTTSSTSASATTFEDTIRRTMERMEDSSAKATSATEKSGAKQSDEDMIAEMLRALESEGGGVGGEDGGGDLSKMFLGMMEQLTNKDMLYEPMKELDVKYPEWLTANKSKIPAHDFSRYSRQQVIVKEIVTKFEEKGYTDQDPKCREFIWEKMQKMQEEGAPPEDLIANPFPGMGLPGLSGGTGEGGEGHEEGCPTQ